MDSLDTDSGFDASAEPVPMDRHYASQSEEYQQGWTDHELKLAGFGPYSDGTWRSTHPEKGTDETP